MNLGSKIIVFIGAIASIVLGIFSFIGYWVGSDVASLVSHLPGIGHTLAAFLYLVAWPWGNVMFPLLFLYLLLWNVSLAHRNAWTRLVGVGVNVFSLIFLFAFFLAAVPLLGVMGGYRWLFLGLWAVLGLVLMYESWWFLAPQTDEVFASNYKGYSPGKAAGSPVGEVVPERRATEKKAVGRREQRPVPQGKKRSLARFYDGSSGKALHVRKAEVSIGRDPENDIVIGDDTVSRKHAVLLYKNGKFTLRDLDSSNGTYVNDEKITEAVISNGDMIRFGQATFKFQLPRSAGSGQRTAGSIEVKPVAWLTGEKGVKHPLRLGKNTIGREEDNTIVLGDAAVSRHHAVLYVEKNAFTIQDLGSSNGTFVNGERMGAGRVRIKPGDSVRFGNQGLTLQEESSIDARKQGEEKHSKGADEKVAGAHAEAFLVDSNGKRLPLKKGETKVGRSPVSDIVIDDATASAHHAVIAFENGDFVLRDLGSTNGTLVNGAKIEVQSLRTGDVVQFGESRFIFSYRQA